MIVPLIVRVAVLFRKGTFIHCIIIWLSPLIGRARIVSTDIIPFDSLVVYTDISLLVCTGTPFTVHTSWVPLVWQVKSTTLPYVSVTEVGDSVSTGSIEMQLVYYKG